MTRAKQLLRFTDKTVEEIGAECGLGAPHYFSRMFREVEGVPPSEFRKQWKAGKEISRQKSDTGEGQ